MREGYRARPRQVSLALIGRDDLLALGARRLREAADGHGHLLFLAGEAGIGKTRLLHELLARAGTPAYVAGAFPGDAEVAGGLLTDLAAELRAARPAGDAAPGDAASRAAARAGAAPAAGAPAHVSLDAGVSGPGHPARGRLDAGVSGPGHPARGRPDAGVSGPGAPTRERPDAGVSGPGTSAHVPLDAGAAERGAPALSSEFRFSPDKMLISPKNLAPPAPDFSCTPAAIGERIAERLRRRGEDGDAHHRRRTLAADLAEAVIGIAAAAGGPVVVALEDLHWADELTLDVLERVARQIAKVPLLLVGTYRSDELFPDAPMRLLRARLLNQRLAEEARLGRLGPQGTAAMLAAITGAAPGDGVVAAVHARSDGIPLHVEEFAAAFEGLPGVPLPDLALPETLADAVRARAGALPEVARRVAGAAAVIGREFGLDLLAAVADEDPGELDEALRELRDRCFIEPAGGGEAFDFRHALIRDALYADVAPLRRRELHRRAAEAGAAHGLDEARVSDHYERAHRPAEAHHHAVAAARAAAGWSAHREAVELFRRAQRTMPSATPDERRAELLGELADSLAATDDNRGAEQAFGQAVALLQRAGRRDLAARLAPPLVSVRHLLGAALPERAATLRAALDDAGGDADRAAIEEALAAAYMLDRRLEESLRHDPTGATLGSVLVFAGRMEDGWRVLGDATRAAERAGREAEAARAYRMIGSSASVLVEYDLAAHWLRAGIAYAERTERFNDRNYMTAHLGHVRWATGHLDDAEALARQSCAGGDGGVTTLITARHVLGYVALSRGDLPAARAHLQEALGHAERMAEVQRLSPALWGLAEVALRSDDPAGAAACTERGLAVSAEVRDAAYLYPHVVTGVRAYLAAGDPDAAADWLARVSPLLRERAIPGTLPALEHAEGLLHLQAGQTGRARLSLERARDGWQQRRRAWEGAQVLDDLARCARRSRRAADGPGPLSSRELEVARLIAGGLTNREIGVALHITPKTVAAHVEHILAKLSVRGRAQVAAWVSAL